jgi:uncharacterized protein (TIGR02284 family)
VKDTFSGSDPTAVLEAAKTGEDHAVEEYEAALTKDVSPEFRTVLQRQVVSVAAARTELSNLLTTVG